MIAAPSAAVSEMLMLDLGEAGLEGPESELEPMLARGEEVGAVVVVGR